MIGDQRVDIVAVDSQGLDALVGVLSGRFDIDVSRERRTLSIPAPDEIGDLAAVADVVRTSGTPVDEIALRRPTLDDAFLALTGQAPDTGPLTDTNPVTDTGLVEVAS